MGDKSLIVRNILSQKLKVEILCFKASQSNKLMETMDGKCRMIQMIGAARIKNATEIFAVMGILTVATESITKVAIQIVGDTEARDAEISSIVEGILC